MRAVLFDFDGVLCDTERAAFRSWQELYAGLGQRFTPEVWHRMLGCAEGESVAVADLACRLGRPIDPGLLAARRRRKHRLAQQEPVRPGVAALCRSAQNKDMRLAVVSSSGRSWVEAHLQRLGLRRCFAAVVTGDGAIRRKPAPDLYHRALWRLGVPRADSGSVLAVEDSAIGVSAALAARLTCVAVPSAVGARDALRDAHLILDSLEDLSLEDLPGALEAS